MNVMSIVRNTKVLVAAAASLGAAGGSVATYFVVSKKLEKKYADRSDREIAEAKRFYQRLEKKGEFETPESAVKALGLEPVTDVEADKVEDAAAAVINYAGVELMEVVEDRPGYTIRTEEETVVEEHNVFLDDGPIRNDDFDYIAQEEEAGNEDRPYVISHDQFMEAEPGYRQVNVSYYVEDDTLADERDDVIERREALIGPTALERFGYGSKDSKIVYVRNPVIEVDVEVLRVNGSYGALVMNEGYDEPEVEIRHSRDSHKTRRFNRGDDE